jgi:hypothetical protein
MQQHQGRSEMSDRTFLGLAFVVLIIGAPASASPVKKVGKRNPRSSTKGVLK